MRNIQGHDEVKEKFRTLFKAMQLEKRKRELTQGQSTSILPAPHLIFAGNPGVNKTEWARVAAGMMYFLGITKTARFVEVKRADLVSQYANGTTEKTKKVLDSAKDGVLLYVRTFTKVVSQPCRDGPKWPAMLLCVAIVVQTRSQQSHLRAPSSLEWHQ